MYLEKRPTCVTVIGWVWIVLGAMMCMSSAMGYAIWFGNPQLSSVPANANSPDLFLKYFPFLFALQICLGILAISAGIQFLKLKAWARTALEAMTWLLLLYVVGFGIAILFWVFFGNARAPVVMMIFMLTMLVLVYGLPLVLMLVKLRGKRVRSAIAGIQDPTNADRAIRNDPVSN